MSLKDLQNLEGRVALVTGGSRGLGLQMAEVLGELGATVVITARKKHELEDAAATLTKQSVKVETVVNDLQDSGSVQPLVEGILERHGQIDVVINNAGAAWGERAEDHSLEAWEKVINLNLTAPFLLSQMVGKLSMIPRRSGRIINIASIAGLVGKSLASCQQSLTIPAKAVLSILPALLLRSGHNTTSLLMPLRPAYFRRKCRPE